MANRNFTQSAGCMTFTSCNATRGGRTLQELSLRSVTLDGRSILATIGHFESVSLQPES